MKLALFALLFWPAQLLAMPCLDYLGGAKYCEELLKAHPDGYAAGFFATEFGDALPCVTQLFESGKVPYVRIQLWWESSHDYPRESFDKIAAEAKRWEPLARRFTGRVYLSGATEHLLSESDAKLLASKVMSAAPSGIYVNSPDRGGAHLPDVIDEVHGEAPEKPEGRYIVSTDGTDIFDVDVKQWRAKYPDALFQCAWAPRFNLIDGETKLAPKERTAKPSVEYIKRVVRLFR